MPAPHPPELRQRVVDAYENGEGTYDGIAERFKVGVASVSRWLGLLRRSGTVEAKPTGGARHRGLPEDVRENILALVRDEPNWTTEELSRQVEDDFGLVIHRKRIGRVLRAAGFSFKRGSPDRQHLDVPRTSPGGTPTSLVSGSWTPAA